MKRIDFRARTISHRACLTMAVLLILSACASTPQDRGATAISSTIASHYKLKIDPNTGQNWQTPMAGAALEKDLSAPLNPESAVQIALRNNPRMRLLYADLGIAQAELLDATRIANPSFDWLRLKPSAGNLPAKLSFGLSQSVTDLLMLGARRKLVAGNLQRTSSEIRTQVATLIFDTESAYWRAVSAEQVRAMRELVAESAKLSSDLAERFFAAGNINRAQRAQENAAAAEALVRLKNADADAFSTRANLNQMLGLNGTEARLKFAANLPNLAKTEDALATLQALAQSQRSDLAAHRQNVTLLTAILASTQRWRWFGSLDISAERERTGNGGTAGDGEKLRGIGFSLGLPIFNQGQGRLLHAQSMLEMAIAQRDQMESQVQSEVALGLLQLNKQREIVETYADVLVPARETAVAEMQKRYNFMLIGAFELLQAKQAEYEAYQGYLDALRDYWLARTALKLATGGELPSSRELNSDAKVGPPLSAVVNAPDSMPLDSSSPAPKSPDSKILVAAQYVCPMHSDVVSDKPGTCPICRMALELKTGELKAGAAPAQQNQHQHEGGKTP